MIPLYYKFAILTGGALAAVGGFLFLQKLTAPAALPTASGPLPSSGSGGLLPQTGKAPKDALLPNGQTQAEVDAISAQNAAELDQMLQDALGTW